ncbi:GNAT family N-acetyltransferase [Salinimicrobium soli]|uniref:GNAT family N-acetyltransferase n=1 Tax=Salinimicrobium soli TaxID=1254399 RepID=UPI003AACFD01
MITIRELDRSYNDQMLEILAASPMKTPVIEISFDRSPNLFLLNELWSQDYRYYGVFVSNKLVGFGKHLQYQGYFNETEHTLSYFGDFCIVPRERGKGYYKQLVEYMISTCLQKKSIGYTVIFEGNKKADSYFSNHRYRNIPGFRKLSPTLTRTLLITGRKDFKTDLTIRTAEEGDKKAILKCVMNEKKDLAQVFDRERFEKKISGNYGFSIQDYFLAYKADRLVGICGAWNMKGLKRTRVLRYKKKFLLIYFIYNLLSKLTGNKGLPRPGRSFNEVYLTDVWVRENDPEIFKALLFDIYKMARSNGQHLIHYGSTQNDPLLKAFKSFFSVSLKSSVYVSSLHPEKWNSIKTSLLNTEPHFDITKI